MGSNSFGARSTLDLPNGSLDYFRVAGISPNVEKLPYSMKVLLENLLRHEGDGSVSPEDVEAVANWDGGADDREISFMPARVLMQDFTGVPAVVDLAAMRDGVVHLGGDPSNINPQIPVELVIDHSVTVESFGLPESFRINAEVEFERNQERYRFLRWGQQAFDNFKVVPPDTGICHQVNLEYLSRVVFVDDAKDLAYPDTLVGTDSHTPMVNGLGVMGWGVGGIEAEAALLGQPISMLIPKVVGLKLTGELREGTTATDLVLTVTELLRYHGVVGKFVEFYGPGVSSIPLENRATLGNMSPEYGSTITIFPIDDETLRYMTFSGRPAEQVTLVERYAKEQGLWFDPSAEPIFSKTIELDLATVVPSIAGPARPQDRTPVDQAKEYFAEMLPGSLPNGHTDTTNAADRASAGSFPASDPPAAAEGITGTGEPDSTAVQHHGAHPPAGIPSERVRAASSVTMTDGTDIVLDHGHVAIAAITSCTNTSNPSVMLAAGLLAKNAVEKGLTRKPWVKTSLAPGSKVVIDYYHKAGLMPYLEKLGYNLVGFGCTTCIGNSGPLDQPILEAVEDDGLALVSVLSGNRNFEGRINPGVRMNFLMSPPLVIAYALAGTMDFDMMTEPLGTDPEGNEVFLRDIWPTTAEINAAVEASVESDMFTNTYDTIFDGDERWRSLDTPEGALFSWDNDHSTYIHQPPFFTGMPKEPSALNDISGARVLALLGDSVTTDHISPAGQIAANSPAGEWLTGRDVERRDFNSYGSRRGNHEVMIRGTFGNVRLRNQLAPGTEGGFTRHQPDGEEMTIYDASLRYQTDATPLIVIAGKEYGSGSSRDWAAKGTSLLGIKAVIAESFERIHRSNLIGMGVLPLQFAEGESAGSLSLTGHEVYTIEGIEGISAGDPMPRSLTVRADDKSFEVALRIDTPMEAQYYCHGGILHYVLRDLAKK